MIEWLAKTDDQILAQASADTHDEARRLRLAGDLTGAERLLEPAVLVPTIAHGLYRELFLVYRQRNKIDVKNCNWIEVIERVRRMVTLDNEMIEVMLKSWSKVQKKTLPTDYFDGYRKLKITDGKSMLKASEMSGDTQAHQEAVRLLARFSGGYG